MASDTATDTSAALALARAHLADLASLNRGERPGAKNIDGFRAIEATLASILRALEGRE